jgi:hypothetical protein
MVLAYGLGMPARKRPTPEDAIAARRIVLDGLAGDNDIFELMTELAPLHPRHNTFPGEVFLGLAADALDWCGASRAEPVPLEGIRQGLGRPGTRVGGRGRGVGPGADLLFRPQRRPGQLTRKGSTVGPANVPTAEPNVT